MSVVIDVLFTVITFLVQPCGTEGLDVSGDELYVDTVVTYQFQSQSRVLEMKRDVAWAERL